MKRGFGLLLLVMFLSGFVVAGSFSEINVTLIVSDGTEVSVDSISEISISSDTFWGMYGDYIVIALIVLIIIFLWLRGASRGQGSKIAGRRKRKKK